MGLHINTVKDSDQLVRILSGSKVMQKLRLIECDIYCKKISQLAKIPTLVELDLSRNQKVTDDCMILLPPQLKSLALIETKVTYKSINQIAKLKRLQLLILDKETWAPEDLQKLYEKLPHTAIQLLRVKRNADVPNRDIE